jgi:hypothetical protein
MPRANTVILLLLLFLLSIITYDLVNYTPIFSSEKDDDVINYDDIIEIEDDFDYLMKSSCPVKNNSIAYECLKSLSDYDIKPKELKNEIVNYHTFWKIDEEKSHHLPVLMLQMLSFLATQNLKNSQLIIWVQNYFSEKISQTIYNRFESFLNQNIIQIR